MIKNQISFLKKGVKFHDGSELTADDVVFSFERMKDKPGSSIMIEEIDKVEKVNDYEIKILLKKFFFTFVI